MSSSDQLVPPTDDDDGGGTPTDEAEQVTVDLPPSGDAETLLVGTAQQQSDPSAMDAPVDLDGYEILSELGRGGMGVVYRARDEKLDRTVALKMIIGGRLASDDDVQRFRIEAESAARLDHPGIVPIYEIGEAGGNHFFSMKFIDGSSLSNANETYRSDARASVELMIAVAEAVQHAHERGVLHRDLKPANILLDADGNPLVTDLGLAKRMDGESGLTQTGLAMGTPGFMAPEQAQGQRDITTAVDVFSLGAILYWLQTGEAPFKGETPVKTLMATIEGEAPSLKATRPDADPDLDLICSKAMHSDPARRYSSAATFANDLRAWLDGELLSVRAPTAISVASVWIRKNLRMVLGSTFTGMACGLVVGAICVLSFLRVAARHEHEVAQLGHRDGTWIAAFEMTRHMGDGWQALQYLIVPVVAACAWLNVLLVRPQSREANILAAVTASLAAGVFSFLIGVGWQAMGETTTRRSAPDIELLANAVWLESDLERELAQQVLIQRYPGLTDLDQRSRQRLLVRKIRHDHDASIIPGMWWGVGFASLFVLLPMLSTSILCGVAWLDGMRGGEWFWSTFERSAYCLIFFLIISFWLLPVPPAASLTLGSLAAMLFALVVAVRNSRWYWRVGLGLLPFLCVNLLAHDMQETRRAASAVGLARNDAEVRQRARVLNRLVGHTHNATNQYQAGVAWLSVGDESEYQRHCGELLSEFENAFRPEIAERLAKLSLLRPDLQPSSELKTFYKLAELASGFESSEFRHWFFMTRALSEQRQNHPEDALEWNQRAREIEQQSGYSLAATHLIDALAHLDLDDVAAAKKSAQLGNDHCMQMRANSFRDGHDAGWVDWRVCLILELEVKARLPSGK